MDNYIKRYTLRVNCTILKKLRYIASYNGRTANRELEQLIKKHIEEFETKHGRITCDLSDD